MLSPLTPSETSGFSSYNFSSNESFSQSSSQTSSDGGTQYSYRYEGQVSSYRVLLSGNAAGSQESLTYSKLNQDYQLNSLNVGEVADVAPVEEAAPLLDGAKNILSFIENRIANEKASGASDEALNDLLAEGLKGFKQGFAEAEDILTASGDLNDTVTSAIGTLYQQVLDGVDTLREEYTDIAGSSPSSGPSSTETLAPIPTSRGRGPEDANGVNPSLLTLQQPSNVNVSFISEAAAYSNSVGYYLIDESGLLSDASLLWENSNKTEEGDTVTLENVPAGELGFFIIPNGYSHYQTIIDEAAKGNGVLRFEDGQGNASTVNDTGSVLVYYSAGSTDQPEGERTELSNVYHASYGNLNSDGFSHARSGASADGSGALTIGFEDLPGERSDWDLQDFVFNVSIDASASNPAPNPVAPTTVDSTAVYSSYSAVTQSVSGQTVVSSSSSGGIRQISSGSSQFESYSNQFRAITGGSERGTLSSVQDNQGSGPISNSNPVAKTNDIPEQSPISAQLEYGRKDRFSFELTTLDGDKISITASNTTVYYGEYGEAQQDNDKQLVEGLKDSSRFAIDVTGELDDDEVKAIEELLDQIMALSDEFYNGDINKAYEAALDLGYDQNEIASYALRLNQVEQYKVAAAYQDFMPEQDQLNKGNGDIFSAIGDYARNILDTLNNPLNYDFFDYSQLLSGISEEIDRQIKPASGPSFSDVMADILERAGALNNAQAKENT
ncbi:MAG: DUF5610 domain-containing protein [Cellvibrionaceae bacterium]